MREEGAKKIKMDWCFYDDGGRHRGAQRRCHCLPGKRRDLKMTAWCVSAQIEARRRERERDWEGRRVRRRE